MSSCSSEDGKDSSTITSDSESNADDSFSPKKWSCINSTKFNVSCESLDRSTRSVLTSNRLEDILQCSNIDKNARILITSASYPFHVEWVNSEWSRKCGWSSDEILGLDCKFLQGDATDMRDVRTFMRNLMKSGGRASLDILNYNKDDTLSHNISHCMPLVDNCGINDCEEVSHIALVLAECTEIHHSSDSADLVEQRILEEVGMPLDRREGCNAYLHRQALPPPAINDWLNLTDGLALALLLRYMLRTRAPIALTDLEGRIVHVNPGWASLTGYSAMEVEGKLLHTYLDSVRDPTGSDHFVQLMDLLRLQRTARMHVNVLMNKNSRQSFSFSSASYRRGNSIMLSSSSFEKYATCRPFGSLGAQEHHRGNREPTLVPQARVAHSSQNKEGGIKVSHSDDTSPTLTRVASAALMAAYPSSSMSVYGGGPESCSFKVQLSPVPIGTKHFAVLFIPETPAPTPVPVYSPASVSPLRCQQPLYTPTSTTSSVPIPVPPATPSWSTESLPITEPHQMDTSYMHHH